MTQVTGILEWPERAEGRVRQLAEFYVEQANDPYVPVALGEQYPLRPGLEVTVQVAMKKPRRRRPGKPRQPRPVVDEILSIEGMPPQAFADRTRFEDLVSVDPQPRLTLEYPGCPPACRLIDLFCPIGPRAACPDRQPAQGRQDDAAPADHRVDPNNHRTCMSSRCSSTSGPRRSGLQATSTSATSGPTRGPVIRILASSNDHDVERHIELCDGHAGAVQAHGRGGASTSW
jgi:hypothetical protein